MVSPLKTGKTYLAQRRGQFEVKKLDWVLGPNKFYKRSGTNRKKSTLGDRVLAKKKDSRGKLFFNPSYNRPLASRKKVLAIMAPICGAFELPKRRRVWIWKKKENGLEHPRNGPWKKIRSGRRKFSRCPLPN